MILVTVGMSEFPFDRLLHAVDGLRDDGEALVVQHGASAVRPARARCHAYVPFTVLGELMSEARAIVSHAGVGSIALALMHGKRPVAVPRLRRHRESVDDHQIAFARRLERDGLVSVLEDLSSLPEALALQSSPDRIAVGAGTGGALLAEVHAYLHRRLSPAG